MLRPWHLVGREIRPWEGGFVGATLQVLARLSNLRARAGRTGYGKQQGSEVAG